MLQITDSAFSTYGRVIDNVDTEEICTYMQKFSDMAGVQYIASDPAMEQMAVAQYMENELFGEMPLQIGACFGRNLKMNAVEYHDCLEVNIAATDLILFLGKRQDIEPGNRYDTAKAEMFFVQKGTVYEMYSTTLHYAPCSVNGNQFRAVIVLPRGTNTELTKKHADPLLVAKNKWLIGHPESGLPDSMVLGLYGENRCVPTDNQTK